MLVITSMVDYTQLHSAPVVLLCVFLPLRSMSVGGAYWILQRVGVRGTSKLATAPELQSPVVIIRTLTPRARIKLISTTDS